jgi:hypothetical protein
VTALNLIYLISLQHMEREINEIGEEAADEKAVN